MSACDMAEKIKTQELTSVEITEAIIERIERINPLINAYCTPTFDLARDLAKFADDRIKKGEKVEILNGVPTSIKDLMDTKGIRTTHGSKIFENYIPESDNLTVKRLKEKGIVLLGKTNTPEKGHVPITDNFIFGATKNPWNLERTSGGSSGGAASANAAGISPLALGSDGGGSIRVPSCLCGVYGLKPNYARIPYDYTQLAFYTMSHHGPIVRFVKDAALMLNAMAGPHPLDKYSVGQKKVDFVKALDERPKRLKVGYTLDLGNLKAIDPEVEDSVIKAAQKFEQFDWSVESVKVKLNRAEKAFAILISSGFYHDFKNIINEWKDKMSPTLVLYITAGGSYKLLDLLKAQATRQEMEKILYNYFKDYDILITPTTAIPAFELGSPFPSRIAGKAVSVTGWMPYTFPFNMSWNPAASIPCGWSKDGLPIGMQIVGRLWDEATVLQVSQAFEEIAPWQDKRPQLI
jgi:Asp-tRNA(Asn)/Glu-tRNA(Gln) amidotransferase A subunit family amidase